MARIGSLWIIVFTAVMGCQKPGSSTSDGSSSTDANFGRFEGNIVAAWSDDGRNMTLREQFLYIDGQNRTWVAPAGSVVNGASIPSAFWSVTGGPFEGKYRSASVVHDVGCVEMRESWEDVHRMFYEACRCAGVGEAQAKMLYYAVYHFGPRWQPVTQVVTEQRATPEGQIVEQEVTVQRVVRTDPPPPTPEEIAQVAEYVAEENPEPEAIRKFNRDALHRRPRRGGRNFHNTLRTNSDNGESVTRARPANGSAKPNWAGNGPGRTAAYARGGNELRPVSSEEQQWLTNMVGQYFEQQAGEPRPAHCTVQRVPNGFKVLVQFLHPAEDGQLVPYEGGTSTVRVSRRGQILEVANGSEAVGTP